MHAPWISSYPSGVPAQIDEHALGTLADYLEDAVNLYAECDAFIRRATGVTLRKHVVKKSPALTEQMVVRHCRAHLTGYKVPRKVVFEMQLPKSNVGKVLRRELRPVKNVGMEESAV